MLHPKEAKRTHSKMPAQIGLLTHPSLNELSDFEVQLLRDVVGTQIRTGGSHEELQLLGGIRRQIDREIEQRQKEVCELERLYLSE